MSNVEDTPTTEELIDSSLGQVPVEVEGTRYLVQKLPFQHQANALTRLIRRFGEAPIRFLVFEHIQGIITQDLESGEDDNIERSTVTANDLWTMLSWGIAGDMIEDSTRVLDKDEKDEDIDHSGDEDLLGNDAGIKVLSQSGRVLLGDNYVEGFLRRLKDTDYYEICKVFFAGLILTSRPGDKEPTAIPVNMQTHFSGRIKHSFKVLVACLRVNYSDFFQ